MQVYAETVIQKPALGASHSVKAEYHRLCAQQIQRYKVTRHGDAMPPFLVSVIDAEYLRHKRGIRYHTPREKFTDSCPVSRSSQRVDLAVMQVSGVHQ
jgi:hypothetical protein